MTMLVTIEDAKARLRIVHDAEDLDLEMMIQQASAAVMNYLGKPLDYYTATTDGAYSASGSGSSEPVSSELDASSDGTTAIPVPDEVQLATLLLVGILYRDRDGTEAKEWQHGYLPWPVTSFLYPLRDPVMG
jgi:hypothetical protein